MLRYNFITHPATLISRELFKSVGGFKERASLLYGLRSLVKALESYETYGIPSIVSSFREHTHSLSTSEPLKVTDEAYQVRRGYTKSVWDRFRSYRVWKKRRAKIKVAMLKNLKKLLYRLSEALPAEKKVYFVYTHKNGFDRFHNGLKANTEISYWSYTALKQAPFHVFDFCVLIMKNLHVLHKLILRMLSSDISRDIKISL